MILTSSSVSLRLDVSITESGIVTNDCIIAINLVKLGFSGMSSRFSRLMLTFASLKRCKDGSLFRRGGIE